MKLPDYWRTALIRAARTAAQTFLAVLLANQAGMFEADVLMAATVVNVDKS